MSNSAPMQVQAVAAGGGKSTNASVPMSITLTGYTDGTAGDIAPTDNLLAALAKLEARVAALEA